MKLTVKRIIFALMLSMSTLTLSMYNDKDDCHTRLMDTLDIDYSEAIQEISAHSPIPIPAAAMPNPTSYTPDLLPQLSPLRTTTWLADQESNDLEDFDIEEFLDTDLSKALLVETASKVVDTDFDALMSVDPKSPVDDTSALNLFESKTTDPIAQKRYTCPSCLYETQIYAALKDHIISKHTIFRPFVCPDPNCTKMFSIRSYMCTHLRKMHPGMPFPPTSLQNKELIKKALDSFYKDFPAPKSVSEDVESVDDDTNEEVPSANKKKWQCKKCDYSTPRLCTLKGHILCKHTSLSPYICPQAGCKKTFKSLSNRHHHVSKEHPQTQIPPLSPNTNDLIEKTVAPHLPSSSSRSLKYNTQKRKALEQDLSLDHDTQLECPLCEYNTQEFKHFKSHLLCKHTTLSPYICPASECKKAFNSNPAMRQHAQRYHPGITIPPLSPKTKDSIIHALAPLLKSTQLTARQTSALQKRKSSNEESVDQNDLEDYFDLDDFIDKNPSKVVSIETAPVAFVSMAHSLPCVAPSLAPTFPVKEKVSAASNIPSAAKDHRDSLKRNLIKLRYKKGLLEDSADKEHLDCPVLECKYTTQDYNCLKSHILCKHTKTRPFICPKPECKREFNTNSNLNTHAKKEHPGMQIPPPSQEVKDSIKNALSPFLQNLSGTKE